MDPHHTGQEEELVKVRMATDSVEVTHGPRRSHAKCAVAFAAVMGFVVVVLVAGFILHGLLFHPCHEEAPPKNNTTNISKTYHLKVNERGRYDIFTSEKGATYLIYGWVKFSNITNEPVRLILRNADERTLDDKRINATEVFFFQKIRLASHITISIYFMSNYTASSFHVYEL